MVTPAGLAEIKTYADGIGLWKPYIVPVKRTLDEAGNVRDLNGDGKVDLRDVNTQPPIRLIDAAHKAGLFVHAYTCRNEAGRIPTVLPPGAGRLVQRHCAGSEKHVSKRAGALTTDQAAEQPGAGSHRSSSAFLRFG